MKHLPGASPKENLNSICRSWTVDMSAYFGTFGHKKVFPCILKYHALFAPLNSENSAKVTTLLEMIFGNFIK